MDPRDASASKKKLPYLAAGFSLQCLFPLSSFLSNKFSDLYISTNLSPLHLIKALMLAAPKLIKTNYQVTNLQAFLVSYVFSFFRARKKENRKGQLDR